MRRWHETLPNGAARPCPNLSSSFFFFPSLPHSIPFFPPQSLNVASGHFGSFQREVLSADFNEDASRLLQIYLPSYGRADARRVNPMIFFSFL